jgi:hypothetical protein
MNQIGAKLAELVLGAGDHAGNLGPLVGQRRHDVTFRHIRPRSQNDRADYLLQVDMMSAMRLVCMRHDTANFYLELLSWQETLARAPIVLQEALGGLADVERDLIRTRTAEGRSRAKARGQHMGRPPKLTPQQQKEARRRRAQGETLKELAKSYNVGKSTISRLDRE